MTNLTNIESLQSPSGDKLELTPLLYNGSPIGGSGSYTGGDGVEITGSNIEVDLYTTQVYGQTLNVIGVDPIHDGGYTYVRPGVINSSTFYDQSTGPRPDAPEYAMFRKPDGTGWDIVYADDNGNWYTATTSSDPTTWTEGDSVPFTSISTLLATGSPSTYYTYGIPSGTLWGAPDADVNVSYSGGTGAVGESYLEFVGGKLKVDFDQLQNDLGTAPVSAQTYASATFTAGDAIIPVTGLSGLESVTDVRIIMDTPFDAPVTLSVGQSGDNGSVTPAGVFDVTTMGTQIDFGWTDLTTDQINIYVGSGASTGSGRILLQLVG